MKKIISILLTLVFLSNFSFVKADTDAEFKNYELYFVHETVVPDAISDADGNKGENANGVSIYTENAENVLHFENTKGNAARYIRYNLDQPLNFENGTVTIEFTAKLPEGRIDLNLYGDVKQWNWSNNTTKEIAGTQRGSTIGFTKYSASDIIRPAFIDSKDFSVYNESSEVVELGRKMSADSYHTYRFVIDNETHTQKIYIKNNEINKWYEQYSDVDIYTNKYYNPNFNGFRTDSEIHRGVINEITNLKYIQFGFYDTCNEGTEAFYFKDIKIIQDSSELNEVVNLDFTNMQNLPENILHGAVNADTVKSELKLSEYSGDVVLEWTKSEHTTNGSSKAFMEIPLEKPIVKNDFPLIVEYSAKLNGDIAREGTFSLTSESSAGENVVVDYGISKWYNKNDFHIERVKALSEESELLNESLDDIQTGVFKRFSESSKIKYNGDYLAENKFYVHKYVINADGTYSYFIKEDNDESLWEKPFGERELQVSSGINAVTAMPNTFNSLKCLTNYFTGNVNTELTDDMRNVMAQKSSDYYKYLKVSKFGFGVVGTSVPDGGFVHNDSSISVEFNLDILESSVNSKSVIMYCGNERLTYGQDYSAICNDNILEIELNKDFNNLLNIGSDIRLELNNLKEKQTYEPLENKYKMSLKYFSIDALTVMNVGCKYATVLGEKKEVSSPCYIENQNIMIPADLINEAYSKNYNGFVSTATLTQDGLYTYYNLQNSTVVISDRATEIDDNSLRVLSLVNGIFVSPQGSELPDFTIAKPTNDIMAAIEKYKSVKNEIGYLPPLYLMSGDYYLDETIRIDSEADGLNIKYYNGEVNLYGSSRVGEENITIATKDDCNNRLPEDLIGKIVRIDLSSIMNEQILPETDYNEKLYQNFQNAEINDPTFELIYDTELVDKGKVKTISRWPDNEWAYMGETQYSGSNATFVTNNSLMWDENADDLKIMNYRWFEFKCLPGKVTEINPDKKKVSIYQETGNMPFVTNSRYYFYNIPEEISAKGEYYIDYNEKAAYYYPEDLSELDEISFTGLKDGIIRIDKGTKNIKIEGINLSKTRGSAIVAYECEDIDVRNCKITDTGDCGIYLKDCTKCDLTSNIYDNIGNISVYVRGGNQASLTSGENTITDSRFTNGARIGRTYNPFVQANGVGTLVANNYFYNHPHSAIMFEGNDNIIENNIFDTVVTETDDAGAIYSGRKSTWWGNVIRNNIFKNIRTFHPTQEDNRVSGIYLDDTLPGTTVENNLFYNCSSAINVGGGIGNKIIGNLIYDCYSGGAYDHRQTIEEWSHKGGTSWEWIQELRNRSDYNEALWYEKYPDYKQLVLDLESEAVDILDEIISGDESITPDPILESHKVKGAVVKDNLFVCEGAQDDTDSGVRSLFVFYDKVRDLTRGKWTVYDGNKTATYKVDVSGEYSNNYVSRDLSNVVITDKSITINEKLYTDTKFYHDGAYNGYINSENIGSSTSVYGLKKFTAPDVSNAGTITVDVSDIDKDAGKTYISQSNKKEYTNNDGKYYVNDFEMADDGDAIQMNDNRFFTNTYFQNSAFTIKKEDDGNIAFKMSQSNPDKNKAYAQLFFDDISTKDKTITFEYSIKSIGEAEGLSEAIGIYGYNQNRPSYIEEVVKIEQNQSDGGLYFGDTQVASLTELKAGYVRLKIIISDTYYPIQIYKLTNGEYKRVVNKLSFTNIIPDYINTIKFDLTNNSADSKERAYLLDDLYVYDNKSLMLKLADGTPVCDVDLAKGKTVYLNPIYDAASETGVVTLAIYNDSGKCINTVVENYSENIELKLDVPSDEDEGYYVKYFSWKDINSMEPVNKSVEYK